MSATKTPAFDPPLNRLIDSDSQIIVVPMKEMPWSNRKSQQNIMSNAKSGEMSIAHVGKSSGQ
jgi:hypothetical protein